MTRLFEILADLITFVGNAVTFVLSLVIPATGREVERQAEFGTNWRTGKFETKNPADSYIDD